MRLCVEDVSASLQHATPLTFNFHHLSCVALIMQKVVGIKEQVEVLGGLCQEEALHPVRQAVVSHILHSCITTVSSGRVLNRPEYVETCLEQPGISSCSIKVHDGLYELRSERETLPLRGHPSLRHVVKLWCEAILLPNLVVIVQRLQGSFVVPNHT